jgi:hypothetical protein
VPARACCEPFASWAGAIGVAAVRVAFVHGTDLPLIASGALVAAGAVLAAYFLPRHTPPVAAAPACEQRPAQ